MRVISEVLQHLFRQVEASASGEENLQLWVDGAQPGYVSFDFETDSLYDAAADGSFGVNPHGGQVAGCLH